MLEVTARSAARLVGVNRKSAAYCFLRLRMIIAYELDAQAEELLGGEIELDESYFGGHHKGQTRSRSRGESRRIWHSQARQAGDTKTRILLPVIQRKIMPDGIVYTDCH